MLDDLHQIDSPTLAPLMTLFLERRPAQLHVILLGRRATYGPLTRLYAAEQVLDISEADLRFQPDEIEAYLGQRGFPTLTPETLARLAARTEGWIVALQLMTATAGKPCDVDELLAATQSQHGWLAEYLTTQVLNRLPPAQRAFLFETSILDRFNASLSAAVTGAKTAADYLSALIRAGLPVVQLDSRQEWVRYHHLLRELLQNHLRQETAERLSPPCIAAPRPGWPAMTKSPEQCSMPCAQTISPWLLQYWKRPCALRSCAAISGRPSAGWRSSRITPSTSTRASCWSCAFSG